MSASIYYLMPGEIEVMYALPTTSMTRSIKVACLTKLNLAKFYTQYNIPVFGEDFPSQTIRYYKNVHLYGVCLMRWT